MKYTIKRTNGSNIKIKVRTDGTVLVTAPVFVDADQIHAIVLKKEAWIKEVQKQLLKEAEIPSNQLLYLGNRITPLFGEFDQIFLADSMLSIPRFNDSIVFKRKLQGWYTEQTKRLIEENIYKYAAELGVNINRITIRDQKTRWGSCSSLCNLNFNWRLSIAPMEIINYVMIHEVCHLVYMNHSQQFWELLEELCPQYRYSKQWLTQNGGKLFRMLDTISFQLS